MKTIAIITVTLLLLYGVYKTYSIQHLDHGLDKLVAKGAVILDVRTNVEYAQGHIEGSVNIPLSHLRKNTIPWNTNMPIITCCSHGLRSIKAVEILKARGYKYVFNGGAWSDLEKTIKADK